MGSGRKCNRLHFLPEEKFSGRCGPGNVRASTGQNEFVQDRLVEGEAQPQHPISWGMHRPNRRLKLEKTVTCSSRTRTASTFSEVMMGIRVLLLLSKGVCEQSKANVIAYKKRSSTFVSDYNVVWQHVLP